MDEVKEVDGGKVIALDQPDLGAAMHEPGGPHREVVAHHDKALDIGPVALPQSPDELTFAFAGVMVGVQPLFKLVEHDQDFGPWGK